MNKARVEALTDGIIAIAATIMVLELGIPPTDDLAGLLTLRHTFLAYLNSFFMIYNFWYLHNSLFHQMEILTKPAFLINGVWVFLLTLVPFTAAWVGNAPDATLPELLYSMNLLLWSLSFHWLDHQTRKDNPEIDRNADGMLQVRIIIYACYGFCMVLAVVKPSLGIYVCVAASVALFIRVFIMRGKTRGNAAETEDETE